MTNSIQALSLEVFLHTRAYQREAARCASICTYLSPSLSLSPSVFLPLSLYLSPPLSVYLAISAQILKHNGFDDGFVVVVGGGGGGVVVVVVAVDAVAADLLVLLDWSV